MRGGWIVKIKKNNILNISTSCDVHDEALGKRELYTTKKGQENTLKILRVLFWFLAEIW